MLQRHALKILGLPANTVIGASDELIRAAWRKKARLFHPDSPYGDVNSFHQAQMAYESLCPRPEQILKSRVRVPATSRRA